MPTREERISAMLARRAERPTLDEIETTVGDIRPGDFLVRVDHQRGVKGYQVDAIVASVETRFDQYVQRWGRRSTGWPVESRSIRFTDDRLGGVCWPAEFAAVVRREVVR